MSRPFDLVLVGGGIVGLATAWQVTRSRPDLRLALVEAESEVGRHQSSHNSGVVHAGVYYAPGSLKARLCLRGKALLEEFCAQRSIPLQHNGKLVVAVRDSELGRLADLYRRAAANGVEGLRRIEGREIASIEPAAVGRAALHSPRTGVVDFHAVVDALAREVEAAGVTLMRNWPVARISQTSGGVDVIGAHDAVLSASGAIVCAGLQADRLAGAAADGVRVVPFRGGWYVVDPEAAASVRGSIYPVPDPQLPFLGVHLTRRIDGAVWAGPNAFLALSRRDYRRWAIRPGDARSALGFSGLWRFASHNMGTAWSEFAHDLSPRVYARSLRHYLPAIRPADLRRGPLGLRAQAMSADGRLLDDFVLRQDGRVMHVLNAPSPAATSSLAIGEHLATAGLSFVQ